MDFKDITQHFKKVHLIGIVFIIAFNLVYFSPQLEGKKVKAHDAISSTAWTKLPAEYQEKTGEKSQWNSSMFSGMPWGFLSNGAQYNFTSYLNDFSHTYLPYPVGYMIKAGLLTFLAFILLGISPWLSVILALGFTYNVNYVVLIEAGHGNKLEVLAGFPLLISGLIIAFRGKTLLGFLVVSLSVSIAFLRNHPQMVYYLLMLLFVFSFVYFIFSIKNKQVLRFLKISLIIIAAFAMGAAANISQIMSSKDFSDDTMRGKPILESTIETTKTSSSVDGLNWDYAMGWSFAKEDLFSVLIPRAVGGSSNEEIGKAKPGKNTLANALQPDPRFQAQKDGNYIFALYFGGMGSTGGSAYLGAAIIFLFIFSLFLLSWKNKVAFVITVLFLIGLSLGKNLEILNLFLFENLPFYNKFRAPSSIINLLPAFLVIAIGIGLDKFLKAEDKSKFLKPLLISGGITAGIAFVYYLYAMSGYEKINEGQALIIETRKSLLGADVLRSILIIGLTCLTFYLFIKNKIKSTSLLIGIGALILIDLVLVGKRYLDEDSFVNPIEYQSKLKVRPVDQQIFNMEPKGRAYYRVFDQSIQTFNSALTSYHHNTIGGYSAAKLQRYQDLIDFQISKGNMGVINMLNTKYFISDKQQLQLNNQANGVAWFIKEIKEVTTSMEEIKGLDSLKTKEKAVILSSEFNKEDFDQLGDGTGNIILENYLPNRMTYSATNTTDQFAVFSEVWYGRNESWKAYIDGKEAKIVRVNYLLRGLEIPANSTNIEFVLDPPAKYASVSVIATSFLLILLVAIFLLPKTIREKLNISEEK